MIREMLNIKLRKKNNQNDNLLSKQTFNLIKTLIIHVIESIYMLSLIIIYHVLRTLFNEIVVEGLNKSNKKLKNVVIKQPDDKSGKKTVFIKLILDVIVWFTPPHVYLN